jgi:isopenicillin-N N-acyltransferase like protein
MSIPTHHSTEVDAGDRGRAFGRAHAAAVGNTVVAYRRLFQATREIDLADIRELGIEVGEQLTIDWPDLHEEIAGIAAGAGVDVAELLAINARTEILAGGAAPECSTIGILPEASAGGTCILAQNWDWHPDLAASRVLWSVHEPSGRWFTTLTEAGILAKIGVSSVGIGCCLNLLATTIDGGVAGVPVHILLRLVLQRCDRLSDALYLLLNAPTSASSCITVGQAGDGDGMMVSVEVSPGGAELIWPNREGWLVHTNHFLDESSPIPWSGSVRSNGSWQRIPTPLRWAMSRRYCARTSTSRSRSAATPGRTRSIVTRQPRWRRS